VKAEVKMVLDNSNKAFMDYCRWLYDENCHERSEHGQKPYKHFEVYYFAHTSWLRTKYEERQQNNNGD
jgi:hypothetical protein